MGQPIQRNRRYERRRWIIFAVTWLTYVCYYLARKSFAVAKVAFDEHPEFGIDLSRESYGLIDSSYLAAYAAGQFLWGPLGDRIGPRAVLLIGILLAAGASIGSGFSTGLVTFAVFAVVQGAGQSTGWPSLMKTLSAWFSVPERGRVMGWWCTSYAVGAALAPAFAGLMMMLVGRLRALGAEAEATPFWPAGFWAPAVVLGGIFVLILLFHRSRPRDVGLPAIESYHGVAPAADGDRPGVRAAPDRSWRAVLAVLRTGPVWVLAVAYFSIKLTRYAFLFWGPKYINESLGTDTLTSAITSAALPAGGALGVLASGFVSDRLFGARRTPVTIGCLLLAALTLVGSQVFTIPDAWLMGLLFFVVGFFLFGPDALISATAAMDVGRERGAGTSAGLINGVGSIGAILGGALPGLITTAKSWTPLFAVFIGGLLFSALILLPLWRLTGMPAAQGEA